MAKAPGSSRPYLVPAGQIWLRTAVPHLPPGEMLGKDQPVILQLLEVPHERAQQALKGVMM